MIMLIGIWMVMKSGAAKVQGKPEITADSITKGTFYQWAWIMSESQRADYYPAVFIDGTPMRLRQNAEAILSMGS